MTWLNLLSVQPRGRTSYRFQDGPEKRTEPILQSGSSKTQGSVRAPLRSKLFAPKSFSTYLVLWSVAGAFFAFALRPGAWSLRPRSWALQRPVRTRHQSTAKARAIATMIFLRRGRLVLGL